MKNFLQYINYNKPILVLGNYRSGSTALCNTIGRSLDLPNYDEDFYHQNLTTTQLLELLNSPCVFKIQPDHVPDHDWNKIIDKCFIVGISRRNIAEQVASFYTCVTTGLWHNSSNPYGRHKPVQPDYNDIIVDHYELQANARYIIETREKYNKYKHIVDVELFYEDIKDQLWSDEYNYMHRAANYDQLIDNAKKIINDIELLNSDKI